MVPSPNSQAYATGWAATSTSKPRSDTCAGRREPRLPQKKRGEAGDARPSMRPGRGRVHLGARQRRLLPDLGRRRRLAEAAACPAGCTEATRGAASAARRRRRPGHRRTTASGGTRSRGTATAPAGMSTGRTGPDHLGGHGAGARDLRHLGRQLGRRRPAEHHADQARHLTVPAEQRLGRRRGAPAPRPRGTCPSRGRARWRGPIRARARRRRSARPRSCRTRPVAATHDEDDRGDASSTTAAASRWPRPRRRSSPPPRRPSSVNSDGSVHDDRHRLVGRRARSAPRERAWSS